MNKKFLLLHFFATSMKLMGSEKQEYYITLGNIHTNRRNEIRQSIFIYRTWGNSLARLITFNDRICSTKWLADKTNTVTVKLQNGHLYTITINN